MRLLEFQEYMKQKKISYVLSINHNPITTYFTKFNGYGCLVVPKKGKPVLYVPKMEYERARQTTKCVRLYKKDMFDCLKKQIKKSRVIGIDKGYVTLKLYRKLKSTFRVSRFVDVSKQFNELRKRKTTQEIIHIKKSCELAVKLLKTCTNNFKFKTEAEVAAFLENETKKAGAGVAFPPIVASGANGALIHHQPKPSKIKNGFLVIDFGVVLNGYCSDITRT